MNIFNEPFNVNNGGDGLSPTQEERGTGDAGGEDGGDGGFTPAHPAQDPPSD